MLLNKLVLFILVVNFGSSEAFLEALASKIIDGIKSAFIGLFRAIGNAIYSLFSAIANSIKNATTAMATDIFAALSASGAAVKDNANKTLTSIFGSDNFNTTRIIMEFMYTGDLPIEFYLTDLDLDRAFAFLETALMNLKIVTFVSLGINLFFNVCIIAVFVFYCIVRKAMRNARALEVSQAKQMSKKKKEGKKKIQKKLMQAKKDSQNLLHIMALAKSKKLTLVTLFKIGLEFAMNCSLAT